MSAGHELTPTPAGMGLPLSEELTRQFYEWERRGRGWQLWDCPVELEPPFRPCYYYLPNTDADDEAGRRQTWLSRLVKRIWSGTPAIARGAESFVQTIPEPEPELAPDYETIIEFEVLPAPDVEIDKTTAEHLVLSLSYCSAPVAFEVVGTGDGIRVQYACRESDAEQLSQQLKAYLPDALVRERTEGLASDWLAMNRGAAMVVDFGLSHEFVRPLRAARSFGSDPLIAVVAALSQLRPKEAGALQVLFYPARAPWAESIFYAVTDAEGGSSFVDAPEMIGLAREKISLPLYAAIVRVAARSQTNQRSLEIARGIGSALAQFAHPGSNEFIPLTNEEYPDHLHEEDFLCRQGRRSGMILNSDELVSIVHPPSASVRVSRLKRLDQRTKGAPAIAREHSLVLGMNLHNGQGISVSLNDDQRCKHMYVVGASGTGKSTFLLNLIEQDVRAGRGIAVLDPHGDLIDDVLARIPKERDKDVVLFDPSDDAYSIGFNILSAHSELEKSLIASDLVAVFRRLSTSWGDQMTAVFNNAVMAMLESSRTATLGDLRRFLVEKKYREEFLKTVGDPDLVYYWEREFPMLSGRPQVPILTRLEAFLRPKPIRLMVTQKENRLDFADIMNSGRIFLGKLAQGAIGEENAYLLGALLVSKFHQMTLSRQELQASQRRPFYLYIDEFHNFVTPSMASILSGVRKYRLGLILAHQELRQVEKRDGEVASAALSNPYTRICFRVGDSDARKLAEGLRFFEANDLQDLGTGQAIARIERSDYDFNLTTSTMAAVPDSVRNERVNTIRDQSRRRYGTPREQVEAALEKEWKSIGERDAVVSAAQTRPDTPRTETPVESTPTPVNAETESRIAVPREVETTAVRKPARDRAAFSSSLLGKGGHEHKYVQNLIKRWAEGMGYLATIEKPLADGSGSVDVVLEKDGVVIACEVSVTTSAEQELSNVRKCVAEAFDHIALISREPKKLVGLRKMVEAALTTEELARVKLCSVEELFAFVESIEAARIGTSRKVRGYKVNTQFAAVDQSQKELRKRAVSKVLVNSLNRRRKDQ